MKTYQVIDCDGPVRIFAKIVGTSPQSVKKMLWTDLMRFRANMPFDEAHLDIILAQSGWMIAPVS